MSEENEIDDALSFLEQEPANVSPAGAKARKKPSRVGRWVARGIFLSLHALVVLAVLNWVGILHTPGFDRLKKRVHEASAPEAGVPALGAGVGPTANGPGPVRSAELTRPSPTPAERPKIILPSKPAVKGGPATAKRLEAKVATSAPVAKPPTTLAEKRGVVVEDEGDHALPAPEKGARPPRFGAVEKRGKGPSIEKCETDLAEKTKLHDAKRAQSKLKMLNTFDSVINQVKLNGSLQAAEKVALLERLKAEKVGFETSGTAPKSDVMNEGLAHYQRALHSTRRPLILAYEALINALIASNRESETGELIAGQKSLDQETMSVTGFAPGSAWDGERTTITYQDEGTGDTWQGGLQLTMIVETCEGDRFTALGRFSTSRTFPIVGMFDGLRFRWRTDGTPGEAAILKWEFNGTVEGFSQFATLTGLYQKLATGVRSEAFGQFQLRRRR